MSLPPPPPPLEQLGQRPFSFYPAIANIEHNEWMYRQSTWSETLVRNTKTGEEVWVRGDSWARCRASTSQ